MMIDLQGKYITSYRRVDSVGRFNVGRVLVIKKRSFSITHLLGWRWGRRVIENERANRDRSMGEEEMQRR
jgi:hypothetical protein